MLSLKRKGGAYMPDKSRSQEAMSKSKIPIIIAVASISITLTTICWAAASNYSETKTILNQVTSDTKEVKDGLSNHKKETIIEKERILEKISVLETKQALTESSVNTIQKDISEINEIQKKVLSILLKEKSNGK